MCRSTWRCTHAEISLDVFVQFLFCLLPCPIPKCSAKLLWSLFISDLLRTFTSGNFLTNKFKSTLTICSALTSHTLSTSYFLSTSYQVINTVSVQSLKYWKSWMKFPIWSFQESRDWKPCIVLRFNIRNKHYLLTVVSDCNICWCYLYLMVKMIIINIFFHCHFFVL